MVCYSMYSYSMYSAIICYNTYSVYISYSCKILHTRTYTSNHLQQPLGSQLLIIFLIEQLHQ